MANGYPLFVALTALAVAAALATSLRAGLRGRAELLLGTSMIWNFLIIVPIYVLGLTNALYRARLAFASAMLSSLVLGLAIFIPRDGPGDARAFVRQLGQAALSILRMPIDGVVRAARQRSLVTPILVFASLFVAYSAVQCWLVASYGGWDALWYHEPMIGFAIQNHGFAFVDLPADAQKINGYPRLVEMTQLWFVVFTDRRLLELLNSVMAPALVSSVYLLCRRYTTNEVHAMGWGASLLVMPVVSHLFQTIYVDVMAGLYVIAAIYFATKEELSLADALLAAMCLGLSVGSKLMAIVPVAVVSVLALVRLVRAHARKSPLPTIGVIGAALVVIGGIAASTYLRNYFEYHNPLWPDFKYDNDKWNIHWPGSNAWMLDRGTGGVAGISMNQPLEDLLETLYSPPYSKKGSYYFDAFDYGFTLFWVILPLSAIGFFSAVASAGGSLVARLTRLPIPRARPETWNLLLVSIPGIAMLYTAPALWSARYNIASLAIMITIVAWLGGRRRCAQLGEGAVSLNSIGAIVMFFWLTPRPYYTPKELREHAKIPYPRREFISAATIAPTLNPTRGSVIKIDAGLAREAELRAGDVVVFDEQYGNFPALFWNNRYTNAIYFAPAEKLLEEAKRRNAKWVYCRNGDVNLGKLRAPGSGYQEIPGGFDTEGWGTVFRRVP